MELRQRSAPPVRAASSRHLIRVGRAAGNSTSAMAGLAVSRAIHPKSAADMVSANPASAPSLSTCRIPRESTRLYDHGVVGQALGSEKHESMLIWSLRVGGTSAV
jgi:hypothetical protein